jgi:hypothetical protein
MGFRRRTRRRALIAGTVAGGAIAHHEAKQYGQQQPAYDDQAPADDYQDQAPADDHQEPAQYAPPPVDPADELEHRRRVHRGEGENPRVLTHPGWPEDVEQTESRQE